MMLPFTALCLSLTAASNPVTMLPHIVPPRGTYRAFASLGTAGSGTVIVADDGQTFSTRIAGAGLVPANVTCNGTPFSVDLAGDIMLPDVETASGCLHDQLGSHGVMLATMSYDKTADAVTMAIKRKHYDEMDTIIFRKVGMLNGDAASSASGVTGTQLKLRGAVARAVAARE